jgi:hypothetical protein
MDSPHTDSTDPSYTLDRQDQDYHPYFNTILESTK